MTLCEPPRFRRFNLARRIDSVATREPGAIGAKRDWRAPQSSPRTCPLSVTSARADNIIPLLDVARDNISLSEYLIGQVQQSSNQQFATSSQALPSAATYPGDILLAEDTTGTGHSWRLVDDQPWRREDVAALALRKVDRPFLEQRVAILPCPDPHTPYHHVSPLKDGRRRVFASDELGLAAAERPVSRAGLWRRRRLPRNERLCSSNRSVRHSLQA